MEQTTFDNLPKAVDYIIEEMAELKKLLGQQCKPSLPNKPHPIEIDEACRIIMKAKSTIYTLVRKGLIPCYKVGKKLYFYEDELLDWIANGRKKNIAETKSAIQSNMWKGIKNKPKQKLIL